MANDDFDDDIDQDDFSSGFADDAFSGTELFGDSDDSDGDYEFATDAGAVGI